jgi:hypothetical protein
MGQKQWQRVARFLLLAGMLCTWMLGTGRATDAARQGHVPARGDVGQAGPPRRPDRGAPVIVLVPPYAVNVLSATHAYPATPARRPPRVTPGLRPMPQDRLCRSSLVARRFIQARQRSSWPAAVDLSRYDPPVANEAPVRADAAWATAYSLVGWWARKDRLKDDTFAPMSVYAPLARGQNRPVSLADVLALAQRQGIATQADYPQGTTDYTHGPTRAERLAARRHRIASYACVYAQHDSPFTPQAVLKAVLAAGQAVVLALPVYDNLLTASTTVPFVDLPPKGAQPRGAEAAMVVKYDSNGVWVENQWGAAWGLYGYAELSWGFVDKYAWEAWVISVGRHFAPGRSSPALATPTPTMALPTGQASAYLSATPTTVAPCAPDAVPTPPDTTPSPSATTALSATPPLAAPCAASATAYPTETGLYTAAAAPYPTDTGSSADLSSTGVTPYPTEVPYPTDTPPSDTATSTAPSPAETPQVTPTLASPTAVAQVTAMPTSGAPGTSIYLSGTGFGPGYVLVSWNGTAIGYTTTDGNNFSYTIAAPADARPGTWSILCFNPDTNATASTPFTVTAAAPTNTPVTPTPTASGATPTASPLPTAVTPTPDPTAASAGHG